MRGSRRPGDMLASLNKYLQSKSDKFMDLAVAAGTFPSAL